MTSGPPTAATGISTCGETRREGALQHAAAGDGIGPADAANAAEQADAASDVDCAALGQDSCHNPDCVWCSSAAVKSKCYTPVSVRHRHLSAPLTLLSLLCASRLTGGRAVTQQLVSARVWSTARTAVLFGSTYKAF